MSDYEELLTCLEALSKGEFTESMLENMEKGNTSPLDQGICHLVQLYDRDINHLPSEEYSNMYTTMDRLLSELNAEGKITSKAYPVKLPKGFARCVRKGRFPSSAMFESCALGAMYDDATFTPKGLRLKEQFLSEYRLNRLALLGYLIEYLKGEL